MIVSYRECDNKLCSSRVKWKKGDPFPKRWGTLMKCVEGSPKFDLCPECVANALGGNDGQG